MSLLKAWKVTGMDEEEGTHNKLLAQEKISILKAMWRLNYSIYPIASLLPACACEQGNGIGSVRIYIYICVYKFFL